MLLDRNAMLQQILPRAQGDVAVRGPVEAVAPDTVLGVHLPRQAVDEGVAGHRLMKRRVKDRHVGIVGQELPRGANAQQVRGIVQWRQLAEAVDGLLHLFVDQHRMREILASMHHAVADRADLLE